MSSATDEKCLICDDPMRFFKTEITVCTGFSERPLFQLFDLFLGISLALDVIDSAGVCQECFVKFNEMDEHQQKIKNIQQNLLDLFKQTQSDGKVKKAISKPIKQQLPEIIEKLQIENFVDIKQEPPGKSDHDDTENLALENNFSDSCDESSDNDKFQLTVNRRQMSFSTNVKREMKKELSELPDVEPIVVMINGLKRYECDVCKKICAGPRKWKLHREIHLSRKTLTCDLCGGKFRTFNALNFHKKIHTDRPARICDLCGASYLEKNYLRRHMISAHLKRRDYVCNKCGKAFSQAYILTAHMAIHSEEKNFVCATCGFKTCTKNRLMSHMKTHTDERKHSCEICGKKYRQSCSLKEHMNTIHGNPERNFPCLLCDAKFLKASHVTRHLQFIHSRRKSMLRCDMCGKQYKKMKTKVEHMRKVHHYLGFVEGEDEFE